MSDNLTGSYIFSSSLDLTMIPGLIGRDSNGNMDGCGGTGFSGRLDTGGLNISSVKIPNEIMFISNTSRSIFGCLESTANVTGDNLSVRTQEKICDDLNPSRTTPIQYTVGGTNWRLLCKAGDVSSMMTLGLAENYLLVKNINMGGAPLTPIGTDTNLATTACDGGGFSGSFNAQDHSITNYNIADGSGVILRTSHHFWLCYAS